MRSTLESISFTGLSVLNAWLQFSQFQQIDNARHKSNAIAIGNIQRRNGNLAHVSTETFESNQRICQLSK